MLIGLNFLQTLVLVTIGGITGFYFFYFLSGYFIHFYQAHQQVLLSTLKHYVRADLFHLIERKPQQPGIKINRKMRTLAKLRQKYGFWGIIVMTPCLLSIPLGAFLLRKYYSGRKHAVTYMTVSILGWALLFTSIVIILPKPF